MITFKELSIPLKIAVVIAYIVGTFYAIAFILGMTMGLAGVI